MGLWFFIFFNKTLLQNDVLEPFNYFKERPKLSSSSLSSSSSERLGEWAPILLVLTHIRSVSCLWRCCPAALKWKKMFSYYLIQSEREAGAWRGAHWAPLWQSRLCCVYPPLSHTLIRLSFSLIETPPQWHSIRAAEWKPGYFYIFFPPPGSAGARPKELISAL